MESERLGWIDAIIEKAKLPQLTDFGGALIVYNNLTCSGVSEHTFRRFPIPYLMIGRERRYRIDDIIVFARQQLAVPVRVPPPRRRKQVVAATATANP